MKVYHPTTGAVYEGEPVDCRELMQVAGYTKLPAGQSPAAPSVVVATDGKPTQAGLDEALAKLSGQIAKGEYKDPAYVVASMKAFYGELFTLDNEVAVKALFPAAVDDPIEEMSKAELKVLLDKKQIVYPTDANKAALLGLVKNIGKAPDETQGKSAKVGGGPAKK